MGCGGSMPVSQMRSSNNEDLQYFERLPKLREKRESLSIEEARKRREECAKQRARRASVMGQLAAEKLTQRKRSNASMLNVSASDVSEDVKIPTFEPNEMRLRRESSKDGAANGKNVASLSQGEYQNSTKMPALQNFKKSEIEITIIPGSRPTSSISGISSVHARKDRPGYAEQLPGMVASDEGTPPNKESERIKTTQVELEETIRRKEANAIVHKAINSALARINNE